MGNPEYSEVSSMINDYVLARLQSRVWGFKHHYGRRGVECSVDGALKCTISQKGTAWCGGGGESVLVSGGGRTIKIPYHVPDLRDVILNSVASVCGVEERLLQNLFIRLNPRSSRYWRLTGFRGTGGCSGEAADGTEFTVHFTDLWMLDCDGARGFQTEEAMVEYLDGRFNNTEKKK